MRNKKAIFAGALMVPALALTGGIAYASTTGGPPTPARTAVTTTVQPTSQHPAGQVIHYRCDWQRGDHHCDWRGHNNQRQATQRQATQRQATRHPATQHRGYRNHHGYQGRNGYSYTGSRGYQGNEGYQGGYSYQGNHCGDGCGW